jgi:hypothetical protein
LRPDAEQAARERDAIARLVANPDDVARFGPEPQRARPPGAQLNAAHRRGFRPTGDPSLDGSGVRSLIVTTEALVDAFQPLADWKTRRGVPTTIRTIEWIESRTRRGVDRAETLRNFLAEAYQLWGLEYVLLGGDSELLSPRYAFSTIYGGGTTPADLYLACLDGNWNADHDQLWGEGGPAGAGESDILPELAVGRAPVSTPADAQAFVQRVIDYETPVFDDYQARATFLAEVLIPANWDSGQAIQLDGAPGTELMINQSVPPSFDVERLYDTYWLHAGSARLTRSASLAAMNSGRGIVNHLGHGFLYTMSCGDHSVDNSDADALTNGRRTFVLVMANCAAVAFDYECLAEHLLANPGGGAAAVIGASRSVSASLIVTYNRAFHRQLFEHGRVHAGDLLNALRMERAALAEQDGSDRWIQFCLNTLGDPEMPIFTAMPQSADVAVADSIPVGPDSLLVTVTTGGMAVAGATVCAQKPGDVYAVAVTDAAGHAVLEVDPRTAGSLDVTVSGANLKVRTLSVPVTAVAAPVLAIAGRSVDDDDVEPSFGNGNGAIEAGETIAVTLSVQNLGPQPADSVVAVVSAIPGVEALSATVPVGDVGAGATVAAPVPCVLRLDAALQGGSALDVPVQFEDALGRTWNDRLRVLVCAPVVEVVRVEASASPQPGLVQVAVEVENLGSGTLGGLTATLVPFDSTAVPDAFMAWSAIAPHLTAPGAPLFQYAGTVGAPVAANVVFEDEWRRSLALGFDGVPPPAPPAPVADVAWAPGTVRLTWPPAGGPPDRDGWHVFRSTAGGSFVRMTPHVIVHADWYDIDVVPNANYAYYVVAVDKSRQWSAPSAITNVNTMAAPLAGWPVQVAAPTASSVAVGDLDGDGRSEVVVGDDGVYAWDATGVEVLDGDSNSTTQGVFSTQPGIVASSVALAAIDAQPGLEIVAGSWLTNKIFVWNGQGQLLPGWPREPLNGGNPGYWSTPAVGDVDGDGAPEIVAISKDGNLYAWHADGTPLLSGTDGTVRTVGAWTQTTPALADLDGDGKREIIASGSLARLDVIGWDGSDFPGWPQDLFAFGKGSPAVGDVDADGDLEIVLTTENDRVHVFNTDGTERAGWPKILPMDAPDLGPSPALGDLDGDGRLEIVLVAVKGPGPFAQTKLYALDADGGVVLEKLLGAGTQSSPVLADLNGDGSVDIVHGGEPGVLHAWDLAGNELAGFPIPTGDFIRATPQYCDLDVDGVGDLVLAGWNRNVYAWRMAGAYRPDRAPWPSFHGNIARDGFLSPAFPTPAPETPPAARLGVAWSPNPFNPTVTLRLAVPGAVAAHVRVDVFDARGRLVRRLVDGMLPAGSANRIWDGRDDAGHALPSGVYVYRVDAAGETARGKLTLVR